MEIVLIVVSGLVAMTALAVVGDYLTKARVAQATANPEQLQGLQKRIEVLETRLQEQDAKIALLENDVSFTTKLLEDKNRS